MKELGYTWWKEIPKLYDSVNIEAKQPQEHSQ